MHICSGATALAHAVFYKFLGKYESKVLTPMAKAINASREAPEYQRRTGRPVTSSQTFQGSPKPAYTDMNRVILGTALLWVGWFGFNGGSALGANVRAASACVSTHLAACTGAVTNVLFMMFLKLLFPHFTHRWIKNEAPPAPSARSTFSTIPNDRGDASGRVSSGDGSSSTNDEDNGDENTNTIIAVDNAARSPFTFDPVDFCNGAVVGLVAITPAAGFVPHYVSPVFGIVVNILVVPMIPLSHLVKDKLLVFVIHAGAGFWGMIFTGVFARGDVAALDGYSVADDNRGALDGAKYGGRVKYVNELLVPGPTTPKPHTPRPSPMARLWHLDANCSVGGNWPGPSPH